MTAAALLSVPPFLSAALISFLGVFVLSQNWREYLNRVFFSLCAALSIYNFAIGMMYVSTDPAGAALWARTCLYGPVFLICLLPHFSLAFLGFHITPASRAMMIMFYLTSALFVKLNISHDLISRIHVSDIGYVSETSNIFTFFALTLVASVVYSIHTFTKAYSSASDEELRLRIRHVLFGISVCSFLGFFDLIKKTLAVHQNFSTFEYGIVFFAIMTAYSIVKHRLLHFEVVFSRGILYSLMMLFVAVIFLAGSVVIEQLTQSWLGSNSFAVNLLSAMIIALLFEPVRNLSQRLLNKHLFPRIVRMSDVDELILRNQEIVEYLAHNRIDELKKLATMLTSIIEKHEAKK